jgi:hypothetical protein
MGQLMREFTAPETLPASVIDRSVGSGDIIFRAEPYTAKSTLLMRATPANGEDIPLYSPLTYFNKV